MGSSRSYSAHARDSLAGVGLPQLLGSPRDEGILASFFDLGKRVAWILGLVKMAPRVRGGPWTSWESTGPMISAISPI
jgi:hypothetical protein